MRLKLDRVAVAVAAASMMAGLAACGNADYGSGGNASHDSRKGGFTVGLLLPEDQTPRYEDFDRPLMQAKIKELCGDCTVEYGNAHGDVALQHRQVDAMISKGVDVLILDAIEPKALRSAVVDADDADIPVVAYDRSVEGPVSSYVSFDGKSVVRMQSKALLQALGDKAEGAQIVRVEGPEIGPDYLRLPLLESKADITETYQAPSWNAQSAYTIMTGAIASVGPDNIDGVFAANDPLAAGVISALKDAGLEPLPPVTGQDAELAAVQRIVQGEQYMTVYKPFKPQAETAAEMAVALGRGEGLDGIARERVSTPTTKDIPAVVLKPIALTVDNIKDTVVKDGVYTIDQICTPDYESACKKAGLSD